MSEPQSLHVGFDQRSGEMMVYGGTLVGLFLLSLALTRGEPALALAGLAAAAVAYYHFPLIRKSRPQISMTRDGLSLYGLGTLPWKAIDDFRIVDKAVRSIRNAELTVHTRETIEAAVSSEDMLPTAERFMYSAWRHSGPNAVTVKLEPLAASPETIAAAIQAFRSAYGTPSA